MKPKAPSDPSPTDLGITAVRSTDSRSASEVRRRAAQLQALGEMTGGVAHDLGNILAAVDAGLRLAEASSSPAAAHAHLAATRLAIARGIRLTGHLRTFLIAKQSKPGPVNVNRLLEGLQLLLKYAAGPDAEISLRLASPLPSCIVDPAQFSAAVLNLVANARDAMSGRGEIELSTARCSLTVPIDDSCSSGPARVDPHDIRRPSADGYVRVRVADRGSGMTREVVSRIFDRFFTTKSRGTGLGLPHVRAFMRRMGGQIRVVSEPGCGTSVDLLFPEASALPRFALSAPLAPNRHRQQAPIEG